MSDKAENASPEQKAQTTDKAPTASQNGSFSIVDDERLRYLGFDVGPSKIGDLFRNKAEEEKYIQHIREKHQQHDVFRDTSNFREERLSAGEKVALIVASVVVLLVFFLPVTPMISGYVETRTELTADGEPVQQAPESGATDAVDVADQANVGANEGEAAEGDVANATDESVAGGGAATEESATEEASATPTPKKSPSGFQDVQVSRTRTRIEKTPFRWSGLQLLIHSGELSGYVFSSGIFVILSAITLLLYALSCLLIPLYILVKVFTIKGSPDDVALQLKGVLRLGWAPLALFALLLLLSLGGGSYGPGYDPSQALKQLGDSFSIATVIGLLGPGFFIALGGFVLAGAKSVEI